MNNKQNEDNGSPPPLWVLKLFTRINVWVYRLSRGRLMNKLAGRPILLVGMTGAKTGKPRTIPLMFVPHERGYLLVASQGGAPRHPLWYHNLVAHPEVNITFSGETKKMVARRLTAQEKDSVWPVCCQYYPPYQAYQDRTNREIPVFLCE